MPSQEAKYYTSKEKDIVSCELCPHNCLIHPGKTGICGVRRNDCGRLVSEIYGKVTAIAMDPIEKKPLYHFYPGSRILSIGTLGCNMHCPYCQNHHISQNTSAPVEKYTPEHIIAAALEHDSIGIAYTYSEPIIWYEYVYDTAVLARENSLKNVLVTNGFINRKPLEELLPHIDAMNIDLKTFNPHTYKTVHKAELQDVMDTIAFAYEQGCHIELTTLIVTGLNDTMSEMSDIINFIASIDKKIPWHISRYYPQYKYQQPATDINFIMNVYEQAKGALDFVYCGNIASSYGGSDTICPACKALIVARSGYQARMIGALNNGACSQCGTDLYIKG